MQDVIVYLIVIAAIAYLVRQWVQTGRGKKSCGGCSGGCGGKTTTPTPLIQIQMGNQATSKIRQTGEQHPN